MKQQHWETLLAVIDGQQVDPLPVGLIIDSPWLPNWAGMTMMDYFSSEPMWLEANLKAMRQFPDVMFLPGFWSEFGMCTEPSAFGARCRWSENEFPFADTIIQDVAQIPSLEKPQPAVHGLLPMVLKRLEHARPTIEREDCAIRFAVARGPLNIASFLMGSSELMMALVTDPDEITQLLELITDFLVDWVSLQIETFPTIDGVFLLDDLVGFVGENDFQKFALPYLKRIYDTFDVRVKFFHNDAPGLITAKHLPEIGVNLFNFSHEHSLTEIRDLAGDGVTLLGNIPPRDVLAAGTPDDVSRSVRETLDAFEDQTRLILSCGGGVPPGVATENIQALLAARL
jgi:uroporphyrinogen-III decarboxylase